MTPEAASDLRRGERPAHRLVDKQAVRLVLALGEVPSLRRAVPVQAAIHVLPVVRMQNIAVRAPARAELPQYRGAGHERAGAQQELITAVVEAYLVNGSGERIRNLLAGFVR